MSQVSEGFYKCLGCGKYHSHAEYEALPEVVVGEAVNNKYRQCQCGCAEVFFTAMYDDDRDD